MWKHKIVQWGRDKGKREAQKELEKERKATGKRRTALHKKKEKEKKIKKKRENKERNIWVRVNYNKDLKNFKWLRKRKQIFKRDNYICQRCGAKKNLRVHHKKYIPGKRPWQYNEKYLITLCDSCHTKEHLPEIKAKKGNNILDKEFDEKNIREL